MTLLFAAQPAERPQAHARRRVVAASESYLSCTRAFCRRAYAHQYSTTSLAAVGLTRVSGDNKVTASHRMRHGCQYATLAVQNNCVTGNTTAFIMDELHVVSVRE
jgi:hypothetical protein